MRLSAYHIPTLKEAPADAQVASHVLLIRGGYMRRLAAGIYSFLPLGWRVIRKIEQIIREEMNRANALEVLLPVALPGELWVESGRWQAYGPELLRFQDRKGAPFCLGPTHEEAIVDLTRRDVRSYRQLPLNFYQIQTKFRDEMRPRAGLLRGREFIMKDAYSFDASEEGALKSYRAMYDVYCRIFARCGLSFRAVEADTGAIGGSMSHEFQVLADSGEDALVSCDSCKYAANVEQAELRPRIVQRSGGEPLAREAVATPGRRTIEEVSTFLKVGPETMVKTLLYVADGKTIAVLVRGDRNVNETKLKRLLGAAELVAANEAEIERATGAKVGFAGPVGLEGPVYVDLEVEAMANFVVGANQNDTHLRNVNIERDFVPVKVADLRTAAPGDACARCETGRYVGYRGIEVGHVFFLGTKYSVPMKCTFLDESGAEKPMVMGCYGIGVTRIAAAAIEQHHDASGIRWPMTIAPFQVAIVADSSQPDCARTADAIYVGLVRAGLEVLYDDRDERLGPKFKDADLVGVPIRITVGKKALAQGVVEFSLRRDGSMDRIAPDAVVARAKEQVDLEIAGAQWKGEIA